MTSSPVHFSARVDFDQVVAKAGIIVYQQILTNVGDAYNSTNGYFTAPQEGWYIFDVTMVSTYYERMFAALVVDDQDVMFINAGGMNYMGSGSNAAIVFMNKNETAFVRVVRSLKTTTYIPKLFSTFTGAKLPA